MTTAPPFASMFAKPEEVGNPSGILLYGPPGTWKTSTAGGIVKVPSFAGKKVLYIDIDQGSKVFVNDPEVYAGVQEGRIDIVPIDKLAPEAFGQLKYFLGGEDEHGQFQKGEAFKYGYDVVVLDSLDVAQDVAINWYMNNTIAEKTGKKDTLGAWGKVGPWTTDVAWAFQNYEGLGIVVMHSAESTSESGVFAIKPKLGGSAKDNIASIFDLVAYVDFEANPEDRSDVQLVATLGKSDYIVSKNRWMLPDKIWSFDLPSFYQMIHARRADTAKKAAALQAA